MNTKRLALTTLALAAAGGASAQSSVTLYGIVDAYVQYLDGEDSMTRLQSGGINGSRLGVRGSEDLGGGLKAIFTLESGINIDDGTTGQSGVFWGRQAFVGLGSDFGTLTLGRQYGSVYYLTSDFSAFSNNNTGPSTAVIGGFGAIGAYEPVRGASLAGNSATGLGGPARVNNSVKYESPSFSGFKVGGMWGFGEVGDEGDNRTGDIYARFTSGPFDVMLSYMDDKRQATPAVGTTPAAPEIDAKTYSIGGAWTISSFRILGGYLKTKDDTTFGQDGEGWWVGGDYRIGPHLISAQYVQNSPDQNDSDTKGYGIGYRYDFSKRTAVYTSLTYFDNDNNVVRAAAGVPTKVAVPVIGDQQVYEFVAGIRHSF